MKPKIKYYVCFLPVVCFCTIIGGICFFPALIGKPFEYIVDKLFLWLEGYDAGLKKKYKLRYNTETGKIENAE